MPQVTAILRGWPKREGQLQLDGDSPSVLPFEDAMILAAERKPIRDAWIAAELRYING